MVASTTDFDINETSFLKDNGITVGLWGNAGITYNAASPDNNFNGPVTFGDRSGEFQLNQLNLFIQRAVATEGDSWDFGGRFDAMFGTDAIFTQAYGVPAFDVNTGFNQESGVPGILIFSEQKIIAFMVSHYLKLISKPMSLSVTA